MEKERAGRKAADYVEDGMVVGLGTGSTAYYFVEELGKRVRDQGLRIRCVSTSKRTTEQARTLGLTVLSVDEVDQIDLTVDGADEVDPGFNGIKGGGGALLIEKIIATNSKRNIWVVDSAKLVDSLGAFPLPVEVVPYGSGRLFSQFKAAGYEPTFRMGGVSSSPDGAASAGKAGRGGRGSGPSPAAVKFVTDMGHYIIDLHLGKIDNPLALANQLDHQVGVVEHGLFLNVADIVIVGRARDTEILTNRRGS